MEKYNNLIILHNNLKGRHDALTKNDDDNNKDLLEKHDHLTVLHSDLNSAHLEVEDVLKRAVDDITHTKANLEQLGIVVQRMSAGASGIKDDLKGVNIDLVKTSERLGAVTVDIADINSKTNTLETDLREQRTDFDNHIKYAERLKNLIYL